jgi:hypothetical protein
LSDPPIPYQQSYIDWGRLNYRDAENLGVELLVKWVSEDLRGVVARDDAYPGPAAAILEQRGNEQEGRLLSGEGSSIGKSLRLGKVRLNLRNNVSEMFDDIH